MEKDLRLRNVFDQVAKLYDKVRPDYPEELFDGLVGYTGINENSKLLEIGPGTGQATLPLARRGFSITAIEIGSQLAEILRQKLSDYPSTRVITKAFEDVDFPTESFDLVYASRSFHWVRPEVRFAKPHQLLKSDGYLAILNLYPISDGEGDHFYQATQPLYNKHWPDKIGVYYLKKLDEVRPDDIDDNLFELTHFKHFPYTVSYTAQEYCDLLNTESDKLALSSDKRVEFLQEIKQLINTNFGGRISRHYAGSLTIAKRK